MKVAIDGRRWMSFLCSVPDLIPISVTIVIISLNIRGIYWQDFGHPNQNSILQALQYAAKAHEIMIIASLANVIVYRIQHDLRLMPPDSAICYIHRKPDVVPNTTIHIHQPSV